MRLDSGIAKQLIKNTGTLSIYVSFLITYLLVLYYYYLEDLEGLEGDGAELELLKASRPPSCLRVDVGLLAKLLAKYRRAFPPASTVPMKLLITS